MTGKRSKPVQTVAPGDADNRALLANARPSGWQNPVPAKIYDFVVIGAGPAGQLAAREAHGLGAKVALIERDRLGGVCLNTGCIPSKTIISTSRLYEDMRTAENYGARTPDGFAIDFPAAMERVRRVRARIGRQFAADTLRSLGVDVFFGEGSFTGPRSVAVDGRELRFKKALIAAGSRATIPPIPGLEKAGYLTNENVFDLTACPPRLLVIGGGPLGCELAQAFCRLGSRVTIVQNEPMFLGTEERDAAQILSDALARDGVDVNLNTVPVKVRVEKGEKLIDLVSDDYRRTVAADAILIGVGRTPNVEGLNLELAGVDWADGMGVRVDDFLRTSNNRIYAAGDVCTEYLFQHIEAASSHIVVRNALCGARERVSDLTIPWCTYTDPEIAHVGLYVREARAKNIPVKTFTVPMHDVHRAICDGEEDGFVKIHVREGTDRILGATVVARHAGEMINDISLAIGAGIGLGAMANVIHPYPTQAEAIKMAARAYVRASSARCVTS